MMDGKRTSWPEAGARRPARPVPVVEDTALGRELAAHRRRRMRIGVAAGVMAVLVVGATALGLFVSKDVGGFGYDESSRQGQAPYKSPEEIQAELDRMVEEGMFSISIESVIEFDAPDAEGLAYIENVPGNRYDMQVTLTLDDAGEVVYESKAIAPGNFIESIKLAKQLEAGTHNATALFTALDRTTHEEVGQAAAEVKLSIGGA